MQQVPDPPVHNDLQMLERELRTTHYIEKTREALMQRGTQCCPSAVLFFAEDQIARPKGLVHEIREGAHQVQSAVIELSHPITKAVPERIADQPSVTMKRLVW